MLGTTGFHADRDHMGGAVRLEARSAMLEDRRQDVRQIRRRFRR
jgi:hypothetical protein